MAVNEGTPAKAYRDLRVYQLAFKSAIRIFMLSKAFPSEERFSLTDQVRRSSRAVCACIAEAWRKRRYPKSFVNKLSDADMEATETQVWLDFALEFRYVTPEQHRELNDAYDHICSQLAIMMAEPAKWIPRSLRA